jgi:hypothetical protein
MSENAECIGGDGARTHPRFVTFAMTCIEAQARARAAS